MPTINLGQPTGPHLRDLSLKQERALDDWLSFALVCPPDKRDEMPVDYTRALASLAKRRGIRFAFSSHNMRLKGDVPLGKNIPGCVGGSKRTITVTERPKPVGNKVEPWNERDWRE